MRYLITGGSGYIGTRLTELLGERDETERIVNVDVRPPERSLPKTSFVSGDVRDSGSIRSLLEREEIDCLIHLAFILDPIRDEARMYDVDVNGTKAVLDAASDAGIEQVMVTSSGTAYGAFPDNPVPIAEDWPVRGQPDFAYARDKADADRICQLWAAQHPDAVMTIVRPCIVFGPSVKNYIVRSWENQPFFPHLDGVDVEMQLIHEDDLVAGLILLLDKKAPGAVQLRRRRHDDLARGGGEGRHEDAEDVLQDGLRDRQVELAAAPAAHARPSRQHPLHPLAVGGLEREAEGARVGAALRHPRDVRDHDAGPGPDRRRAGDRCRGAGERPAGRLRAASTQPLGPQARC